MACSIKLYDGKSFDIDLDGKATLLHNNYYAVGNHILSKSFLKFYFMNEVKMNCVIMQAILDALDEPYTVHVLDQNANLVSIRSDSLLRIDSTTSYSIHKHFDTQQWNEEVTEKTHTSGDVAGNVDVAEETVQEKNKTI
jgi:hypothetical protein